MFNLPIYLLVAIIAKDILDEVIKNSTKLQANSTVQLVQNLVGTVVSVLSASRKS